MQNVLEQGPDFWCFRYNSVFVPLCSPNTCKDVFNPNVTTFQSNCAEGLHFSAFHYYCLLLLLLLLYTHTCTTHTHTQTVDFVLKDPRQKTQEPPQHILSHRQDLAIIPKPWEKSFLTSFSTLSRSLSLTNPTIASLLSLWYESYSENRLIDCGALLSRADPLELQVYQREIVKGLESAKALLHKR